MPSYQWVEGLRGAKGYQPLPEFYRTDLHHGVPRCISLQNDLLLCQKLIEDNKTLMQLEAESEAELEASLDENAPKKTLQKMDLEVINEQFKNVAKNIKRKAELEQQIKQIKSRMALYRDEMYQALNLTFEAALSDFQRLLKPLFQSLSAEQGLLNQVNDMCASLGRYNKNSWDNFSTYLRSVEQELKALKTDDKSVQELLCYLQRILDAHDYNGSMLHTQFGLYILSLVVQHNEITKLHQSINTSILALEVALPAEGSDVTYLPIHTSCKTLRSILDGQVFDIQTTERALSELLGNMRQLNLYKSFGECSGVQEVASYVLYALEQVVRRFLACIALYKSTDDEERSREHYFFKGPKHAACDAFYDSLKALDEVDTLLLEEQVKVSCTMM